MNSLETFNDLRSVFSCLVPLNPKALYFELSAILLGILSTIFYTLKDYYQIVIMKGLI